MRCFFEDKEKALACFTLVSWLDQHKSVKKKWWAIVLQIWSCLETEAHQSFLSMDSTKSTWGHVSWSMLLQGVCSHGLHVFFFFFLQQACGCCPNSNSNNYSSLWILFMSSTFWFSTGWAVPAFLILWFRLGRCSENQLETIMARRSRPRLTQCTSEVMGTSEKSARSRHTGALLHSKSLTMLRISWRSACRIIPRMFSKVETCFFLWEGGWTEEREMMSVNGHWMRVDKGVSKFLRNSNISVIHPFLEREDNLFPFLEKLKFTWH